MMSMYIVFSAEFCGSNSQCDVYHKEKEFLFPCLELLISKLQIWDSCKEFNAAVMFLLIDETV